MRRDRAASETWNIKCLFAGCLLLAWWLLPHAYFPPADVAHADTDVADSWSVIQKGLGGIFTDTAGNWVDYTMTDTDAFGRQYIDLWLVPGSRVEFKAILNPNGTKKYETDFKTSTGRRVLTVPTVATTVLMNWSDTPGPPTALKAYADSGRVTLNWTAPTSDSSLDVVNGGGYLVYYDTGPAFDTWYLFRAKDTVTGTAFTCTNLINDSIYFFSLRSFDAYQDTTLIFSSYSESVQVSPGTPTNIVFRIFVGEMSDSEVYVGFDTGAGWTEHPLVKEGTTSWWSDTVGLYRGFDLAYKFVVKDTAGARTVEFPVSGGRKHMFLYPQKTGVSSVSVKGSWDWGSATAMRLDLDGYWRADVNIPNGGVYEYGFTINNSSWDTDPANLYVRNNNSVVGIDASVNASTMRRLVIPETATATYSSDWEDAPYTPTGFQAMSNTNNTILLMWTRASSIEDLDSYRIEYTEAPGDSGSWNFLAGPGSDSTTYVHQSIIPGDTYYYRITAIDYSGDSSVGKNYIAASATLKRDVMFLIQNSPPRPAGESNRWEFARRILRRK